MSKTEEQVDTTAVYKYSITCMQLRYNRKEWQSYIYVSKEYNIEINLDNSVMPVKPLDMKYWESVDNSFEIIQVKKSVLEAAAELLKQHDAVFKILNESLAKNNSS